MSLIKKIIYRVGQMKPKSASKTAPASKPAPSSSTTKTTTTAGNKDKGSFDIFNQNKRQHLRDLENKAREKEN